MELEISQAVDVLERTPVALSALLGGLPEEWLTGDEGPDTFSPRDVLGHLIHGEETDWIPRAEIILGEGQNRPFTPFDRFGFRDWLEGTTTGELLERFARLRGENLARLAGFSLQPADLVRRGMHPGLGPVTLGQLLAAWVVHDLGHLTQVARVMAKQYIAAVGPWTEYMAVLHDRAR
ncbi:MAG TPA: DinB family protein [Vicinamibacteria bacterium]|nr:DinB family protein [Vicinamibacteria bacterium]